jgi:hypothetical protein
MHFQYCATHVTVDTDVGRNYLVAFGVPVASTDGLDHICGIWLAVVNNLIAASGLLR